MASEDPAPAGRRRTALVIASLLGLAFVSFVLASAIYPRVANLFDFRAFYCAGSAVAEHHDPYRTEPLRSCWNASKGFPHGRGVPFAVPVPMPGYALAPFVLLSRLPFPIAAAFWVAVLLGSFASTVMLLHRLCKWRVETIFAALLLSEGLRSVFLGQIVPIVCAAAAAAALFLTRGRDRAAALAAALTMFEPHLGLPVCLALFIARPRSRVVLASCAVACAAVSFALLGIDWNVEYVRDVLPAHLLSEISNEEQYSLSYVAHLAGLDERAASRLGALSYIVMLAAGIVAGRLAAARTRMPALLLLVPPAFAVFGGPFVHVQQLAIALPAALVLGSARRREAGLCAAAIFLLAIPWGALALLNVNLVLAAGIAFVLAHDLFDLPILRSALVSALVMAPLVILLSSLGAHPVPAIGPIDLRDGSNLAEVGWRRFMDEDYRSGILQNNVAKIPGWCGLLLIALASIGFDRSRLPAVYRRT